MYRRDFRVVNSNGDNASALAIVKYEPKKYWVHIYSGDVLMYADGAYETERDALDQYSIQYGWELAPVKRRRE